MQTSMSHGPASSPTQSGNPIPSAISEGRTRSRGHAWCLFLTALWLGGCGAGTTTRMVDDPAGSAIEYGAPTDTTFVAQFEANKEQSRIAVYESSRCAVIPVTVMQQFRETLRGGEVISREPVTKRQVAGDPEEYVPCQQTYARNVEVLLEVDGTRTSLGQTGPLGMVAADLAQLFQTGSYETAPASAIVLVRPNQARPIQKAGTISLTELQKHQARITELVAELEGILDKESTTPEEIRRSYEIYAQLNEIGSSDPRVVGLSARFWELFYGRQRDQAREQMEKNLDALSAARETLKVMGDAAIPLYVQAAVNSGTMDQRALEWSSLRLIRALRGAPAVCSAGFAFGAVPSYGWAADARLAAQYVQFGYGTDHASAVQAACRY